VTEPLFLSRNSQQSPPLERLESRVVGLSTQAMAPYHKSSQPSHIRRGGSWALSWIVTRCVSLCGLGPRTCVLDIPRERTLSVHCSLYTAAPRRRLGNREQVLRPKTSRQEGTAQRTDASHIQLAALCSYGSVAQADRSRGAPASAEAFSPG